MFKMINIFNWVTDLVEAFTFYGGGKGGGGQSSSTSTPVDFFGKDVRAPYEDALQNLLLGGGPSLDYIKSQPGFMLSNQMGQEGQAPAPGAEATGQASPLGGPPAPGGAPPAPGATQ